jgi:predicted secreted protein
MICVKTRILLCLITFVAPLAALPARAADPQQYNVVNLQASADREIANDQMQAVLYFEQTGADAAQVANAVNRAIADAVRIAKDTPAVKVRTGNNQTMPVYTRGNQLTGWRGRADIRLETRDFPAGAALVAKLQATLQLGGINFSVAPDTRKKAEDELIAEAIAAFKSRAELVRGVMGGKGYKIAHLNLNTGYSGAPRPVMFALAAKSADSSVAPPPVEGGTSTVNVQVSGAIEVE